MSNKGFTFSDLNEDVDDMAFLSHPKQGSSGYLLGGNSGGGNSARENRQLQLLEERRRIEERTLQSSKSSLGLLYESERTGLATAEELSKQREQLSGVEERLDYINSTMRVSQKHLNSMKSIFGGIKSYFSRSSDPPMPELPQRPTSGGTQNNLRSTTEQLSKELTAKSVNTHPSLRNKGIDVSGFGFDEEDEEQQNQGKDPTLAGYKQKSRQIEKQLDSNLTELDHGLGRLKSLALGLGSEIEEQSQLLDRITTKTERAEDTITFQNRQMKKLLK